jgi:hypothetical protein
MTFHTVSTPGSLTEGIAGTLNDPVPFTFVRRVGSNITVRIPREYPEGTLIGNNFILKIDASRYTFANGNRMDRDGNGITGEAGYDDLYLRVNNPGTFVHPRCMGLYVNIGGFSIAQGPGVTYDHLTFGTDIILNVSNRGDITTDILTARLGNGFASGFTVQALRDSGWTNITTGGATFNAAGEIVFLQVPVGQFEPTRIVWNGPANFTTNDDIYGVRQRVAVFGSEVPVSLTNRQRAFAMTQVTSPAGAWHNTHRQTLLTTSPAIWLRSRDMEGRNVVIDLEAPAGSYWLEQYSLDVFKQNFRISRNNPTVEPYTIQSIDIIGIEFLQHPGRNHSDLRADDRDVIRITLDPGYEHTASQHWIIANNRIGYNNRTTPLVNNLFGDITRAEYFFFGVYNPIF